MGNTIRFNKNKAKYLHTSGFTLIELLVVIAIIGLLSSIVFASLNSARLKAREAAIKEGVRQLANLMELEYNDNGSYTNLKAGWDNSSAQCTSATGGSGIVFTGNYAENAKQICANVVANSGDASPNVFYTGDSLASGIRFSIMAWLPGKGTYFCVGSSGANSDIETGTANPGVWDAPGCHSNP